MKTIIGVLIVLVCFASFTTKKQKDSFEVMYDSKPVTKDGIKLQSGKSLQVINTTNGNVYKLEVSVSLGKRPCFQKVYLNEEAMKPFLVDQFMNANCSAASAIIITVNISTIIVVPISQ